ncbi:tRNA (guanosine(46)-N7)-methyltransferase TrmB [Mesorhizobium sp. M9A.F.Ca.ET.002.03.1.2]|uniref:tRNA (guanine(46)-N(7))-methyltransferase TrmB n=1 Tax=Mesorhizobium sp. M9A.F.Ca.ET.002.03.1.2 TaxID=2493668 RepID=UPI000F758FE6|nr:tRNA (guanosine(46)-N(7))-methyltransferase TrmB [Mesorhizobium sp. M9A.F.Ca.ET.002.03.1.2]AZN97773.1 tRNA (guanosine(46)-N7)-methyltransferase TrmB [Mesorhizobium sp. M9A.F.Ca.ET.002.03.1.2]
MDPTDRPSRATEAFFGRRRGKAIRPQQAAALESGFSTYQLDLTAGPPAEMRSLFEADVRGVHLEIGFGGGEHLLHRATTAPETGFVGVEPFVNGMAKLMMAVRKQPLANLRVYDDDATRLLDWLPQASLDGIDLLYPDPWPKKKHWKRRFVSPVNLDRFARVLKSGGKFRFASDIDSYVNWTLLHCRAHDAFAWQAEEAADWHRPYEGWPGTRYEAKAVREGRRPAYLTFVRR